METWQKYPPEWKMSKPEIKFGLTTVGLGLARPNETEFYAQRTEGTDTSNRHVYCRVENEVELLEKGAKYRSYRQISEFECNKRTFTHSANRLSTISVACVREDPNGSWVDMSTWLDEYTATEIVAKARDKLQALSRVGGSQVSVSSGSMRLEQKLLPPSLPGASLIWPCGMGMEASDWSTVKNWKEEINGFVFIYRVQPAGGE